VSLGASTPGDERIGRGAEFLALKNVQHTPRGARSLRIGSNTMARGSVGRSDQRHVLHAGQRDVGDVAAAARDEAAVFLGAALATDVLERFQSS